MNDFIFTFDTWKNLYLSKNTVWKNIIYTSTLVLLIFVLQDTWNVNSETITPVEACIGLLDTIGGHKVPGNR